MALRIGDLVECGELDNTTPNQVCGWLKLRGHEARVPLNLTGNCMPDLSGRRVRFSGTDPLHRESSRSAHGLAYQQVGAVGTMTADRQVKLSDCPPVEFYTRAKLGEPPPVTWHQSLYLEWYSQNGRVVIELVDPEIQVLATAENPDSEEFSITDADDSAADANGARWNDELQDASEFDPDEDDHFDSLADAQGQPPGEDPYGLFPDGLQKELDRQSFSADESWSTDCDNPHIREAELLDELMEGSEDVPISTIFDPPLQLPPSDSLSELKAEQMLGRVLARLAEFGVAFELCKHFTARQAYLLLVERICPEERVFPQLRQTQWVQHFSTSDFCEQCEAEFDAEFGDEAEPPEN